MTEPRQIAVVRSYDELVAAAREQVQTLGINYSILDQFTGFCDTFWSKNLATNEHTASGKRATKRHLSPSSFDAALVGLCFDLVAVENPEKVLKLRAWLERKMLKREGPRSMLSGASHKPIIIKLSLRHMRNLGKMGGAARMQKIPADKRSELARNAAKARWHKPKLIEIAAHVDSANQSALPTSQSSGITRGANKKESPQAARSEARTVRRR